MDKTIPEKIEKYAAGPQQLDEAIKGLSGEDFLKTPVAGTWSIGQIVIHLMGFGPDRHGSDEANDRRGEPADPGIQRNTFCQQAFL